jgi:hypothetical protein
MLNVRRYCGIGIGLLLLILLVGMAASALPRAAWLWIGAAVLAVALLLCLVRLLRSLVTRVSDSSVGNEDPDRLWRSVVWHLLDTGRVHFDSKERTWYVPAPALPDRKLVAVARQLRRAADAGYSSERLEAMIKVAHLDGRR